MYKMNGRIKIVENYFQNQYKVVWLVRLASPAALLSHPKKAALLVELSDPSSTKRMCMRTISLTLEHSSPHSVRRFLFLVSRHVNSKHVGLWL